jgi:hypothetical protein
MGFRGEKAAALKGLEANITIVPECGRRDAYAYAEATAQSVIWRDGNENSGNGPSREAKGLAVFADNHELSLASVYADEFQVILPIKLTGKSAFHLLAVWTKPRSRGREWGYSGMLCRAIEQYSGFLTEADSLVIGDFNTNKVFDGERTLNHSEIDRRLTKLGLTSAYHTFHGESQGEETRPTHYFLRKRERPFHIDHCYLPSAWLPRLRSVSVGEYSDWVPMSDHAPLVIDIDSP